MKKYFIILFLLFPLVGKSEVPVVDTGTYIDVEKEIEEEVPVPNSSKLVKVKKKIIQKWKRKVPPILRSTLSMGVENTSLSGSESFIQSSNFSKPFYYAIQVNYLFRENISSFIRFDFISSRSTLNSVSGGEVYDASYSTFPISLGVSWLPLALSESWFFNVDAFLGYALNSSFSLTLASPSSTAQITQSHPVFGGKVGLGYRISNLYYLNLELGYRYSKISTSGPNISGNNLMNSPAEINLSGVYGGVGLALLLY